MYMSLQKLFRVITGTEVSLESLTLLTKILRSFSKIDGKFRSGFRLYGTTKGEKGMREVGNNATLSI
jgi:hypothetical protein